MCCTVLEWFWWTLWHTRTWQSFCMSAASWLTHTHAHTLTHVHTDMGVTYSSFQRSKRSSRLLSSHPPAVPYLPQPRPAAPQPSVSAVSSLSPNLHWVFVCVFCWYAFVLVTCSSGNSVYTPGSHRLHEDVFHRAFPPYTHHLPWIYGNRIFLLPFPLNKTISCFWCVV